MERRYTMTITAWRNGVIHTSADGRAGGMVLFKLRDWHAGVVATRVIMNQARHGYDGHSLLVPGVPEAASDDEAVAALIAWTDRVAAELRRRLPAGSFTCTRKAA